MDPKKKKGQGKSLNDYYYEKASEIKLIEYEKKKKKKKKKFLKKKKEEKRFINKPKKLI